MKKELASFVLALGLLLSGCEQQQQQNMEYIGAEQAKTLALQDAGLSMESAAFSDIVLDQRNGLDYYDVEFSGQGQVYEYDIDALTGTVIKRSSTDVPEPAVSSSTAAPQPASASTAPAAASGSMISAQDAKSRALHHAGLSADQVSFVQAKLEMDDGRQIYDVEFYTQDPKEYDYEIDAYTGEVLSYDFDADAYTAAPTSSNTISADNAKQIALEQVPGAGTGDIREFETDYDDGRLTYEGHIVYDGLEYEFEIDGYSGAIRSWEAEPLGH